MYTTICPSPIGSLTLASDGRSLTGLWLEGQKYFARTLPPDAVPTDNLPLFARTRRWLESYFAGRRPKTENLPLKPDGSEFQLAVWKLLTQIPYGQVTTYGLIAKQLSSLRGGASVSARAVGGAVGRNPISIIIPCHRVIGADNSLTGYAGGMVVKRRLLELEQQKSPDQTAGLFADAQLF